MLDNGPLFEKDDFYIFSGSSEEDAVWLESVAGFFNAKRRVTELAATSPGDYFIFHTRSHLIVVKISSAKTKAQTGSA
jgi:hypothetical protein